jgi:ABC-type uncharacterized transport system auxiliary subunit
MIARASYVLIAAIRAAPLGGCVSLLPKPAPAPRIYTLEAAAPQSASQSAPAVAAKNVVIGVAEPDPPRALSGADIVWAKNGQISYIDGAQWAGRGPDLLQSLLIHTIDRSGLARGAVRAGEARADSEVRWDLLAFGVTEDGAAEARIAARVNLFTARTRELAASMEVDERAPLRGRSSAAAAEALQQAARQAADKIAAWAVANTPAPEAKAVP